MEHCFGKGEPSTLLAQSGQLPIRWAERYFELLEEAVQLWGDDKPAPRRAIAAIHFATTYLHLKYWSWTSSTGGQNKATDDALAQIRTRSEMWLLGPLNS